MANRPFSVIADNYPEAVPSASPSHEAPARGAGWKRWPRWILLFLACLWAADAGVSVLIDHSRLRSKLTAHLSAAFGRPVDVGRYNFSLWTGPTLEARSITVGEDPRFGREYFVRAESLRVSLRWRSLLRGHIELGTLSLSSPSLNLVRNVDGDWNLDEWLPRPAEAPLTPVSEPALSSPLRFRRIEVDDGRINFKRGDEKLPFAFVNVEGTVEMDGAGRWRMDVDAIPWRAAVVLQRPGVIRVTGDVGGTSSRLLPATLNLTWTDASVSDLLRLARGDDYGVRGTMTLAISARTEGSTWALHSRAELRQLHRWDLAFRSDNPAVNLIAQMKLYPQASGLEFTEAVIEAPHSNAHVSGRISWSDVAEANQGNELTPFHLQLSDSSVDLGDLLAWFRAFHSGVADDISIHGFADAKAVLSGWPPRVDSAQIATDGADLVGSAARTPLHLGPVQFRDDRDSISLLPIVLSFGGPKSPSAGSLRMDATFKPGPSRTANWHLAGNLMQVRDLITTAASFGWNLSRSWDLTGPLRCDLRWQGSGMPWLIRPVGSIDLGGQPGGASLHALFLNHPIERIKAHIDLKPGVRHIALVSAEGFGARWNGSFDRQDRDDGWQFTLSADHLDTADLDRWLNPRWRESFLDRMLPFLNLASSSAVPESLRASGRLSLDQLTLAPLLVHHLQGNVEIGGRHIGLTDAAGQFYGGQVAGSLDAELGAIPVYRVKADFSGVDLSALSAASRRLDGLFAGSASGAISFDTHGASRSDLVSALECQGTASANEPELRNIGLTTPLRDVASRSGTSLFREASAAFTCGDGKLQFQDLRLRGLGEELDGSGSVGLDGSLDLRFAPLPESPASLRLTKSPVSSQQTLLLGGSFIAPRITQVVSRPGTRR